MELNIIPLCVYKYVNRVEEVKLFKYISMLMWNEK